MAARKARKGPKSLYDLVKDIDPTFANEIYAMTDSQLNEKLSEMSKHKSELEEAQKEDQDLQSLREQVRVANETYVTSFKALKLKRKLICKTLQERGKV